MTEPVVLEEPQTLIIIEDGHSLQEIQEQHTILEITEAETILNIVAPGPQGPVGPGTPFARGASVMNPAPDTVLVAWEALFDCTVTSVKARRSGGTHATANARKNGSLLHLANDIDLTLEDEWVEGSSPQNTDYHDGDTLEVLIPTIADAVDQVTVQLRFSRP